MRGSTTRRRRGPGGRADGAFAAVSEAFSGGGDGSVACAVVGRMTARAGVSLGEALDRLHATAAHAHGGAPPYVAVRAMCVAWAEETLALVHRVSCEDVLTGLATPAHLQARLREAYRSGEPQSMAFVVVEPGSLGEGRVDAMSAAYRDVHVGERIRMALPGAAVVCRPCPGRLLVLVRRTAELGGEVGEVVTLVEGVTNAPDGARTRAWIEGLPQTWEGAVRLVSELSRR